jgi:flagellar basal-body rod protein FlgB
MIDRILFGGRKLSVLKGALAAYAERGRVHAANIANADTPGYRAQEVRFEDDLRLALRTQSSGRMERTDARHLGPTGELPRGRVQPREAESSLTTNGINNVEIDREMADLAANTLRYDMAAELVARAYRGMKAAIRGRPGSA